MNEQAISALQALVNTLTDQQKGLQGQIDAINQAIKALQDGGVVAQTAIDQAVSDQVTAALVPVQTAVSSALTSLANEKTPVEPVLPGVPDDSDTGTPAVPADNETVPADTGVVAPETPVEPPVEPQP